MEPARRRVDSTRYLRPKGLLVGSAAELAERFAAEAALGAELFVLQFHDFGAPETLAAFAAGVGV